MGVVGGRRKWVWSEVRGAGGRRDAGEEGCGRREAGEGGCGQGQGGWVWLERAMECKTIMETHIAY